MSTQADRAQCGDANRIPASEQAVDEPGSIARTGMTGAGIATIAQMVAADLGSPPVGDAVISTRDLTLSFGQRAILSGINTDVGRDVVTVVVGPTGSGKTPLQRTFNRMTDNLAQAVRIADRTIFLNQGRMVERGGTKQVLEHPEHEGTASYVGGRFG